MRRVRRRLRILVLRQIQNHIDLEVGSLDRQFVYFGGWVCVEGRLPAGRPGGILRPVNRPLDDVNVKGRGGRHTGELQPVPRTGFPIVCVAISWGGAWSGNG